MMLHLNPEALAENHTDFRIGTMLTDFSGTAHSDVFQTAQDHEAYKKWEAGKRAKIIDKITSNPQIMSDLSKIKAPKNLRTAEDIKEQLVIKERLADGIGGIYAEVYDLKTLDQDDIHVVFQDFNMMEEGGRVKGFVWNIAPGIENDETVIFRESPAKEVAKNITSIIGKKVEATNVAGATNEEEPENQKVFHIPGMVISPSTI